MRCPSCEAEGDLAVEVLETRKRTGTASLQEKCCQDRCAYVETGLGPEPDCRTCSRMEVVKGMIHCSCGKAYPIIGCVPRFLPDDLQCELVDRYPSSSVHTGIRFSNTSPILSETS